MLPLRADNAKSLANTGIGGPAAVSRTIAECPGVRLASALSWGDAQGLV